MSPIKVIRSGIKTPIVEAAQTRRAGLDAISEPYRANIVAVPCAVLAAEKRVPAKTIARIICRPGREYKHLKWGRCWTLF